MSVTYDIGCRDCLEHLWIGQNNYIYTGEKKTMKALGKFLFKHRGHDLIFHASDYFIDPLDNPQWKEYKNE